MYRAVFMLVLIIHPCHCVVGGVGGVGGVRAGEKAQRRDPRVFKYTGISCPDYRKGTCKRGNACPYSHGEQHGWRIARALK